MTDLAVLDRHDPRVLPFEIVWPGTQLADGAAEHRHAVRSLLEQLVDCVDVCAAALHLHALADDLTVVAQYERTRLGGDDGDAPATPARAAPDDEGRDAQRRRWNGYALPDAHIGALARIARHSIGAVVATVDQLLGRLAADPVMPTALVAIHEQFQADAVAIREDPVRVDSLRVVSATAQRTLDAFTWRGTPRAHPA